MSDLPVFKYKCRHPISEKRAQIFWGRISDAANIRPTTTDVAGRFRFLSCGKCDKRGEYENIACALYDMEHFKWDWEPQDYAEAMHILWLMCQGHAAGSARGLMPWVAAVCHVLDYDFFDAIFPVVYRCLGVQALKQLTRQTIAYDKIATSLTPHWLQCRPALYKLEDHAPYKPPIGTFLQGKHFGTLEALVTTVNNLVLSTERKQPEAVLGLVGDHLQPDLEEARRELLGALQEAKTALAHMKSSMPELRTLGLGNVDQGYQLNVIRTARTRTEDVYNAAKWILKRELDFRIINRYDVWAD
ncbi:hypothetical protein BX600DRAFT_508702 [Xylariales sp. PMI_506]|nr:hypothetical protein BX600DRAFT_508702 [Xylariales sp. PMI_506]